MKPKRTLNLVKPWAVAVLGFLLLACFAVPVFAASVIIPSTDPGYVGGVDARGKLTVLFNDVVNLVLLISGGVIVLVVVIIGLKFVTERDARQRAETMQWLLWVVLGSGLVFGATLVTRLLVGLFGALGS